MPVYGISPGPQSSARVIQSNAACRPAPSPAAYRGPTSSLRYVWDRWLVKDPWFGDPNYWTIGAGGSSVSEGRLIGSGAAGTLASRATAGQGITTYNYTFDITDYVSGDVRPYLGSPATYGTTVSGNGTYTGQITAAADNEFGFNTVGGFNGRIVNFQLTPTFNLVAAAGSFTISGQAAGLKEGHMLPAAAGSFTFTGKAAGLAIGRKIGAAAGAFTFTGNAAGLIRGFVGPSASGSFTMTGIAAGSVRGFVGLSSAGAFTLSGQAAQFISVRKLKAGYAAYVMNGRAATLRRGKALQMAAGSFALTGYGISYSQTRRLRALPGLFSFYGRDATLTLARNLVIYDNAPALAGVVVLPVPPAPALVSVTAAEPSTPMPAVAVIPPPLAFTTQAAPPPVSLGG